MAASLSDHRIVGMVAMVAGAALWIKEAEIRESS
jgi:hypothetical protein